MKITYDKQQEFRCPLLQPGYTIDVHYSKYLVYVLWVFLIHQRGALHWFFLSYIEDKNSRLNHKHDKVSSNFKSSHLFSCRICSDCEILLICLRATLAKPSNKSLNQNIRCYVKHKSSARSYSSSQNRETASVLIAVGVDCSPYLLPCTLLVFFSAKEELY